MKPPIIPQIIHMWLKLPGAMKNEPTIPANTMRYFNPQNLIKQKKIIFLYTNYNKNENKFHKMLPVLYGGSSISRIFHTHHNKWQECKEYEHGKTNSIHGHVANSIFTIDWNTRYITDIVTS